jgi:arsenite methyltransferase
MSTEDIREVVRERYAAAATAAGTASASCCDNASVITDEQRQAFGAGLYESEDRDALPDAAHLASLGCGNPTAVADLHEGRRSLISAREEASTCCCQRVESAPLERPMASI